jgi:hypothetical protein
VKRAFVFALLALGACAAKQPPQELVDARAAYERARVGPAAQANANGLAETRRLLDEAEERYRAGSDAARHIAYVAHRRALAAEAEARTASATNGGGP